MLTKNELMAIPVMIRDIKRSKERIEKMKAKLYSPQGFDSREKVQTSGTQRDELVDMVRDFEAKLEAEEKDVAELKQEAIALFETLEPEQKLLMTLRYIGAQSWPEIAEVMNYSPPSLFRRHRHIMSELFPEDDEPTVSDEREGGEQ
jgi:DNA-binding Lrp family transcriptional regulator